MTTVESRKKQRVKKRKMGVSSPVQQYSAVAATGLTPHQQPPNATLSARQNLQSGANQPLRTQQRPLNVYKMRIIGRAISAPMAASQHLTIQKEVYRVSNVDSSNTVDSMKQYLKNIGVRVHSCFDRTSLTPRFTDNKTFRVCILAVDKVNMLNEENWFTGISIQKWEFRPKPTQGGEGGEPSLAQPSNAPTHPGQGVEGQETPSAGGAEGGGGDMDCHQADANAETNNQDGHSS